MKRFIYIASLALTITSAQLFAQPWNDPGQKAFLLTDKNKAVLGDILQYATIQLKESALKSDSPISNQLWGEAARGFDKSLTELNKQVDGIKLSLSGAFSKLTWKERLKELLNSLTYIYNTITMVRPMTDQRSRENRDNILKDLDLSIKKITAKMA